MTTQVVLQINKDEYKQTYIASDTRISYINDKKDIVFTTDTDAKTIQMTSNGNFYLSGIVGNGKYAKLLSQYNYSKLDLLTLKEASQVIVKDLLEMYIKEYKEQYNNDASLIFSKNGATLSINIADDSGLLPDMVMDNKVKIFGSGSVIYHHNDVTKAKLQVYESEFFENGDFSNDTIKKFLKKIIILASQNDKGSSDAAIIHNIPYTPEERIYQVASAEPLEKGYIKGTGATNAMMKKDGIPTYIEKTALINMAKKINKMAKTSTPIPITANHGGFSRHEEVKMPHKFSIGSYINAYVVEDEKRKVAVFNSDSESFVDVPYAYLTVEGKLDLSKQEAFEFYSKYQDSKKPFGFSTAIKILRQEKAYDDNSNETMTLIKNANLSAITLTYRPTDVNAKVIAVASDSESASDDNQINLEIENSENAEIQELKTQLASTEEKFKSLTEQLEEIKEEKGKYVQAFQILLQKNKK